MARKNAVRHDGNLRELADLVIARHLLPDGAGGIGAILEERVVVERLLDARLWSALSVAEQQAAHRIHAAFTALTAGGGYALSVFGRERIDGSRPAEGMVRQSLLEDYRRWSALCRHRRCDQGALLDLLVFGVSAAAADRARKRRKGYSRAALLEGLSLYARMKGWPINKKT